MSLATHTIPQILKMFTNLEGWLQKAEAFCSGHDIEASVLLGLRLYANMYAFDRQVLRALYDGNLITDRLTGNQAPKLPDDADSLEALRGHIATSKAFVESALQGLGDDAESRRVTVPGIDGMTMLAGDMAAELSIPNVYFHLTCAYAILRQMGVDVGKADFIGPMKLAPAVS